MSGIGSRTRKYRGSRKELDEREWKRDLADAFHNHLGNVVVINARASILGRAVFQHRL